MRHWARRAVLLVALLAPAAVAQSSRPAPGANELFAALAAPDHDARTERLRAIRGLLAEPGDARAVTVARAQLDGLLAAEAGAAAEQPPAIVMAALAGRIDGAISRLEKAAASGGEESETGSLPAYAWPALCGLAAVQTLGLLLGLAFMARRLRGAGRTQAVLTRLDQLSPRLDAVLARATLAEDNTADLRCAVSGALAELDAACRQTRVSIEASVAGACARLNEAGAFIEHTERVASALPALMGEAVDSVQARGLPGLDMVVARLEAVLESVSAAATPAERAALPNPALAQAEALAAVLAEIGTGLAGTVAELRAAQAAQSAGLGAPVAALDQLTARLEQAQADQAAAASASAEAMRARLDEALGGDVMAAIPAAVEALGAQLAPIELAAREAGALLAGIDGRVSAALGDVPGLAGRLEAACASLNASGVASARAQVAQLAAIEDGLTRQAALVGAALERNAREAAGLAARVEGGLADAAGAQSRQAEALECAITRHHEGSAAVMAAVAARADAALAVLAPEAGVLSATAQVLVSESAALRDAACRLETAASLPPAPDLPAWAASWQDGMGGMLAGLRDELAALRAVPQALSAPLEAIAARADAALAVLAPEAGLLNALGHRLAAEGGGLREAAGRIEAAALRPQESAMPVWGAALREEMRDIGGGLRAEIVAWRQAAPAQDLAPARLTALSAAIDGVAAAADRIAAGARAQESGLQRLTQAADLLQLAALRPQDTAASNWTAGLRAEVRDMAAGLRADLAELRQAAPAASAEPARMAALTAAIGGVVEAIGRVAARADAQEASLERMMAAAEAVQLAARAPAGPARLEHVAQECERAFGDIEAMAQAAMQGGAAQLPRDLPARLPELLRMIDLSINRLRGCATALALASDLRAA